MCIRDRFDHAVTGFEQDASGVNLKISTPSGPRLQRASYMVACDGGTSGIRELLGAQLKGSTYAEHWLVIDAIVRTTLNVEVDIYISYGKLG